jgi:hypothetical protein
VYQAKKAEAESAEREREEHWKRAKEAGETGDAKSHEQLQQVEGSLLAKVHGKASETKEQATSKAVTPPKQPGNAARPS